MREGEDEDGRECEERRRVRGGEGGRVTEGMRLTHILTNLLSLIYLSGEMIIICKTYFITYESSMSLLQNRQK